MLQCLSKWRNYRGGSGGRCWHEEPRSVRQVGRTSQRGAKDGLTTVWITDVKMEPHVAMAVDRTPVSAQWDTQVTRKLQLRFWLRFRAVLLPFDATGLSATRVFSLLNKVEKLRILWPTMRNATHFYPGSMRSVTH